MSMIHYKIGIMFPRFSEFTWLTGIEIHRCIGHWRVSLGFLGLGIFLDVSELSLIP